MLQPTSGCCLHKTALLCHLRYLLAMRSLNTNSHILAQVLPGATLVNVVLPDWIANLVT